MGVGFRTSDGRRDGESSDERDELRASTTGSEASRSHLALVSTPVALPMLLPRIAAGDERAVRDCVQRYGALVWSLARRWCTDRNDAEDAVQEVFIDLWRTAHRFDVTRASEVGWVAMIARRRLIDRARRRQAAPTMEAFPAEFDLEDESCADADGCLDHATRAEQARAVLRSLPAAQRRLLELSLLDGKTHDEIARETAMPLGTVKSHIRRGLLRARALLLAAPQPLREGSAS